MSPISDQMSDLTVRDARRNAWFSWIGAAVALTGVQLIAPSLPVMRDALGLSDGQLALVMSVYLLPAALSSIPIGMLADRFGRRIVFGSSLVVFGVCGLLLVMVGSFGGFLVVRFFQGVVFAGLLPLTMTILGDAFRGNELIGAQGRRSVAMSLGDAILPVLGGLLVAGGWFVPWLGQVVAIPLGIVVLFKLVDAPSVQAARGQERPHLRTFIELFKERSILALQYTGFLRMFLKFCILTFLPVFLVDVRDQTPAFAGLAVGVAAFAGTGIAAVAGRLARLGRPTLWVVVGVSGMGISLLGMVSMPWPVAILGASLAYGAADGLMGVFINAFVTAATGPEQRAGFVSATGAIRNFAKFTAPAAFAGLTLTLSLAASFMLVAGVTFLSGLVVVLMKPLEQRLRADPVGGAL